MRLGTRWAAGSPPPASVPSALHAAIAQADASVSHLSPPAWWTLTWLEGRPVADLDVGIVVTVDAASGDVVVIDEDDDTE